MSMRTVIFVSMLSKTAQTGHLSVATVLSLPMVMLILTSMVTLISVSLVALILWVCGKTGRPSLWSERVGGSYTALVHTNLY